MQSADKGLLPTPLTSNVLDEYQRARLIRSTRKLEAILGTTPRLADAEPIHVALPGPQPLSPPRTKGSRRHASIFTIFPIAPPTCTVPSDASIYSSTSTNSSMVSFSLPDHRGSPEASPTVNSLSSKPRRAAGAPEPLVLCVNTVSAPLYDHRIPQSPFSSTFESQEPATPTTEDTSDATMSAELRRKRLAKLARTFGERVPVEYVFPSAHPSSSRSRQRRPQGHDHRLSPPSKRSSQTWVTGSSSGSWIGEWNRKDIKEVQHRLRGLKTK